MGQIAGIVVTFNPRPETVLKNIHSLRQQVNKLIVVDNSSEPSIWAAISANLTSTDIVLKNNKNLGIAAALNQGIKKAIAIGMTYVLLMDSDSYPVDNLVWILKNEFEACSQKKKLAAIGPAIFDLHSNRPFPAVTYNHCFRKSTFVPANQTIYCDQIISSGTFMPTKSFTDIGEFNESLFIDFVDIEWGIRAREKGYTCAMTNKTQLHHYLGIKSKDVWLGKRIQYNIHNPRRTYYIARNPWLLARNHSLPVWYRTGEISHALLRLALLPYLADERKETLYNCIKGTIDGLRNRTYERQD